MWHVMIYTHFQVLVASEGGVKERNSLVTRCLL